jgi:hypothetical protein
MSAPLTTSIITRATTYAVKANGAGDTTVITVGAGKKFVVFACYVVAGGAATIEVKSGATAITGEIDLSATVPMAFGIGGSTPIWIGRGDGDDLVFTKVGAVDFDGWVLGAEVDYL